MPTTNNISTPTLLILDDAIQCVVDARKQRVAIQTRQEEERRRLAAAFGIDVPAEEAVSLELTLVSE